MNNPNGKKSTFSYPITRLHILIMVLTVALSGGGVYAWQQNEVNNIFFEYGFNINQPPRTNTNNTSRPNLTRIPELIPPARSQEFSSPYPVVWNGQGAKFFLTGAALGYVDPKTASFFYLESKADDFTDDPKRVLVLDLKITTSSRGSDCLTNNLRQTNTQGDLLQALTPQFQFLYSGGCLVYQNATYLNQKVYFRANESDEEYRIVNTGETSVSFIASFSDPENISIKDVEYIYNYSRPQYQSQKIPIDVIKCANERRDKTVGGIDQYLATTGFDEPGQECLLRFETYSETVYTEYECRVPVSVQEITISDLDTERYCELVVSEEYENFGIY